MNMTDPLTTLATSAATTVTNKGVSKLTDLIFSKKLRQQRRLDHLSSTQDQKDSELIQQGLAEFRDGKFLLINEQIGNPTSPLGLIISQNFQNQSENLGKCLNKAYEYLSEKNDDEIDDKTISETFFNKWINYGKEVSEDELQDLWGRLLSNEISKPNSINYLILNTLSMMSKDHLEAFNSLLPFICDGNLYCNSALSAEQNYAHVSPFILSELIDFNIIKGLLPGDVFFKKELHQVRNGDKILPSIYVNKKNFIALHLSDSSKDIEPRFFLLTTIGQKLFESALSNIEVESYFIKLINNFKQLPQFNSVKAFELVTLVEHQWETKLIIQR